MSSKKTRKSYRVSYRVNILTSQNVYADSLEQALQQARETTVTDVVDVLGEHDDSAISVEGVSDPDLWDTSIA